MIESKQLVKSRLFCFRWPQSRCQSFCKKGTNEVNQPRFSAVVFVFGHNGSAVSGVLLAIRRNYFPTY
jgi:hypothetical protein